VNAGAGAAGAKTMELSLADVAEVAALRIVRDGRFSTLGILSRNTEAQLCPFFDRLYVDDLRNNANLAAVITTASLVREVPNRCAVAVAEDPLTAFLDVHRHVATIDGFYWRHFDTERARDCTIDGSAFVADRNVRIGPGVVVEPNATILERCVIGAGAIIRAGAVVGAEGFAVMRHRGRPVNVPHFGGVEIDAGVEIQSGSVVVRGLFGEVTAIGADTVVGGGCRIGHGVRIGRACRIMPGATICGSTTLGERVWVAANATISNSLTIGDDAAVFLGETVTRDVPAGMAAAKGRILPKDRLLTVTAKVKQRRRSLRDPRTGRR